MGLHLPAMDDSESSTSGFRRTVPEHKTRRPHKKSRFGCTKCKARRIKCDERTPRCSRCEKMDLTCVYRKKKDQDCCVGTLEFSRADWGLSRPGSAGSPGSSRQSLSPMFAASPPSSSSPPTVAPQSRGLNEPSPLIWLAAQTLAPPELELFQHYLEHTSRDPSVVDEDVYTLQVGIPTLACQSKPLMRSVLALAAVCKCSDIIKQTPACSASRRDREIVAHLLSVAHRYHLESLHEIQATLHEAKNYDHVLANAAMMGMYGSGSHCARIWLAKMASSEGPPLGDLMPEYPQWMSLFRAVRLAYAGLLNDSNRPTPPDSAQSTYEHKTSPSCATQHSRAAPTNHPLGPILAATVEPAMAKLHDKAATLLTAHDSRSPDLQACLSALSILDTIVAATFPANDATQLPRAAASTTGTSFSTAPDPSRLAHLSPWLRHYTASITSMIPSRLPRRIIMSLVHKAPTAYLALIEDMLGLLPIQTAIPTSTHETQHEQNQQKDWMADSMSSPTSSSSSYYSSSDSDTAEPSAAHQLALEVFAHWLVLVMLLDDVWWIGGIGAWELGRVVALRREGWRLNSGENTKSGEERDGEWWPEGMWEVARLFERFRVG